MDFYSDTAPWNLPSYQYPTWDDCMRYYLSRTKNKIPIKSALHGLAVGVHQIWKSGDGCPKSPQRIMVQFENTVLHQYQKYRKGDALLSGKKKKKNSDKPSQSPVRKSSRSEDQTTVPSSDQDLIQVDPVLNASSTEVSTPTVSKRKESKDRRESWVKDFGSKLFDVFCEGSMVKVLMEGRCFDSDFYENQLDTEKRKLVIETVRVRKEFVDHEKKLNTTRARILPGN